MKRKFTYLIGALALMTATQAAQASAVFVSSPSAFQVLTVSPNGKWATGVYADASQTTYGFRWNLESGHIDMLSHTDASVGWSVSDNGYVSGIFSDNAVYDNGASISAPGFWADGKWNHLEVPADMGRITDGLQGGITPDGKYVSGSWEIDGRFTPFIWKEGKIHRQLPIPDGKTMDAVPYCISPDGQAAGGWCYNTSGAKNRTCTYWAPDADVWKYIDRSLTGATSHDQSPWACAHKFSPDGKKLLIWGGYYTTDESHNLFHLYDIESGQVDKLTLPSIHGTIDVYGISAPDENGVYTIVGAYNGHGTVFIDGEFIKIEDYLLSRGVNLRDFDGFYQGEDWTSDELPVTTVTSISADRSVLLMNYYGKDGYIWSLAVKIDQDFNSKPVADFKGKQIDGVNAVRLDWAKPLGQSNRGYNIYRNGEKLNGRNPVSTLLSSYIDKTVSEPGTYTYRIGTKPISGEEILSEEITVDVTVPEAPMPLNLFARQKGFNSAYISWDAPLSDIIHKAYFNSEATLMSPTVYEPVKCEFGIRYDKNELGVYSGSRISEVSFFPNTTQADWKVNFYTVDDNGASTLLSSQPVTQQITPRKRNVVKLSEPIALDGTKTLIAAIECDLKAAMQPVLSAEIGTVTPGYSDLMRNGEEAEFYSAYQKSVESSMSVNSLSWAIDLGITADDATGTEASKYALLINGEPYTETEEPVMVINNLDDGAYTVGVQAIYPTGRTSSVVNVPLNIAALYESVNVLDIHQVDGTPAVEASWKAPMDDDHTSVTYTTASQAYNATPGLESNGYAIQCSAIYSSELLHGFDGYQIKSARFYALHDAIFTAMIYEDDKLVAKQEFEGELNKGAWNEVIFETPATIKGGSNYQLVIDVFDPEPKVGIIGLDDGPSFPGVSDLYSVDDGQTFSSLAYEASAYFNWMIGMEILDPEGQPVDIKGYDVKVDSKKVNDAPVTEPRYTHTFASCDGKNHRMSVDVLYHNRTMAGRPNVFMLTSGIESAEVASFQLRRGENYLEATGEGILGIDIHDIAGVNVASANGSRIEVSHLRPAVYVVTVRTTGGNRTQKVAISR